MYACILEIGRGFFEGVCARENRPLTFRAPPPPPLAQEEGSGTYGTVAYILPIPRTALTTLIL
jgi:hypothetical protein